ncbi:hypothetical protein GCM10007108_09980 [Thermogymnomonas acidicola]|uniref:Uncharacterized protein n=1 Tax=Thermogymnomonas acidicola TaxID=399579 RepID=A0AA37BS82_9ARCH|nr:hypothetical protein [Thermogymnomonas acidicola]GGM74022.1 hypothetical protein GCM10007108_09980 [Thermogymnomonas acidicola]
MYMMAVLAHLRKDLRISIRSNMYIAIISLWSFVSLVMALYIIDSSRHLTFSDLVAYRFIDNLMDMSVFLFLIPAILIPVEQESGMIDVYRGVHLPFSVIFTSKLVSCLVYFLTLVLSSIAMFSIAYAVSRASTVTLAVFGRGVLALLTAIPLLIFIFLPAFGYISALSYASSRRWVPILFSALMFFMLLFAVKNIDLFYEGYDSIGNSAMFHVPTFYYPLLVSFPASSIGILAEAYGLPTVNEKDLGQTTVIATPFFHAFLGESGYALWILAFFIIFISVSYLVGRLKYQYG